MQRKRVLISGAGSGWGREAAWRLAKKGHHVIAGVQTSPQITALREDADKQKIPIRVEKLDIRELADREFAFGWEVDVLVNNAGIGEAGPIAEVPIDRVRAVFETNVFATLELSQGFIRQMVKRGSGRVIFMSSVAGLTTVPFTGPYCASKHALQSCAEALREEVASHGVQIATINPGAYLTGFNDRLWETWQRWYDPTINFTRPDEMRWDDLAHQFDPEEIVRTILSVVEDEGGLFMNVHPQRVAEQVKAKQAEAWKKPLV